LSEYFISFTNDMSTAAHEPHSQGQNSSKTEIISKSMIRVINSEYGPIEYNY